MKLFQCPIVEQAINIVEKILPFDIICEDYYTNKFRKEYNLEQIKFFYEVKAIYFLDILSLLVINNNYPLEITIKHLTDISLSKIHIKNIKNLYDFCWLIHKGWLDVSPIFEPARPKIIYPFQGLVYILKYEAHHAFSTCVSHDSRWNCQSLYRDRTHLDSISRKKLNKKPLTNNELKALKRAEKRVLKDDFKHWAIGNELRLECIQAWLNSDEKLINITVKQYLKNDEELLTEIMKPWHPRKNPGSMGWINGVRIGLLFSTCS